jgi:hypothetical protein
MPMTRVSLCLLFVLLLAGSAVAQSCNSRDASVYCGSGLPGLDPALGGVPDRDSSVRGGYDAQTPFSNMQRAGSLNIAGEERPATFGAINFSGGSANCSGMFRSRNC